jgi:uracil-DNA glycosylase
VFPVFHPAAALYQPSNRKVLEEDFAKLRILLARGLTPRAEEPTLREAPSVEEAGAPAAAEPASAASPESPLAPPPAAPQVATPNAARGPVVDRQEQLPLW